MQYIHTQFASPDRPGFCISRRASASLSETVVMATRPPSRTFFTMPLLETKLAEYLQGSEEERWRQNHLHELRRGLMEKRGTFPQRSETLRM